MQKEKHLLVLRFSALGDVAMTVPVLQAFVQQHPNTRITVVTRPFFKPLFAELSNVSVFEADLKGEHKGVFGLFKLFKTLKTLKVDGVADLHNVLRSNMLKLYFKIGGFDFAQLDKGRAEKKAFISAKNNKLKPLKTMHERYADVFRSLGFSLKLSDACILPKREISASTEKIFSSADKKYVGIAPFAAFQGKMYPLDLMEEVVSMLNSKGNIQMLLFGGGSKEKEKLDSWDATYANATSVVGKFSFEEELALISNLNVMLAMDSGNAHLAALYGVQTVTLWGVTHPYAGFYPFQQDLNNALLADREMYPLVPTSIYGNKMPEGYEAVMRTISSEAVVHKMELLITSLK